MKTNKKQIIFAMLIATCACGMYAAAGEDAGMQDDAQFWPLDSLPHAVDKIPLLRAVNPNVLARIMIQVDKDGQGAIQLLQQVADDVEQTPYSRASSLCNIALIYKRGIAGVERSLWKASEKYKQALQVPCGLDSEQARTAKESLQEILGQMAQRAGFQPIRSAELVFDSVPSGERKRSERTPDSDMQNSLGENSTVAKIRRVAHQSRVEVGHACEICLTTYPSPENLSRHNRTKMHKKALRKLSMPGS